MPGDPNKLSQFWHELKRRKVTRVITVYAASAFVILELVDIIAEPFGLPDWTMKLVVVLLIIGIIVSIIVSWIYDIHPEGGVVKTEPANKVSDASIEPSARTSSKSWKIASYISFVVIVGLIVLNIFPRVKETKESPIPDKSIAVRPFWNESTVQENESFVNGMTEDIRNNLAKIADLRVLSRGSVEKYRDTDYTTLDIARELNVSYVLEGTAQRIEDQVKIHVQLILAETDDHIWETSYREEIEDVKQVFDIQNQIAQSVAMKIKAIIAPEENKLMEKNMTISLTAYDFYQRGREEHWKYHNNLGNRDALKRAEKLYYESLGYDSTFAQAYTGLARVYQDKYYWADYFSENYMDSVLIYSDKALSFDSDLDEAYSLKGDYYRDNGDYTQALNEYQEALRINPNSWQAYASSGELSYYYLYDAVKGLENNHLAITLNHGPELPTLLRSLAEKYRIIGFNEKAQYYLQEAFTLDNDSMVYLSGMSLLATIPGRNFIDAFSYLNKAYAIDSTNTFILKWLGQCYMDKKEYKTALGYYQKWLLRLGNYEITGAANRLNTIHRVGYCFWMNGQEEEAKFYFNLQKEYCKKVIGLSRDYTQIAAYYDLACVYAFMGEHRKAFENLHEFNQYDIGLSVLFYWLKNDPLLDSIRNEPEFQEILQDYEAKVERTKDKVRLWLEQNDML